MSRNETAGLDRGTTLQGRRLLAARVLWMAVALLVVGLYVAALPYDFQELQRVCSGDDCTVDVQLTGPDALALEDMGLSIGFYAGFFLSIEILILVVFAVMAGVIFWRRSDDWMALFISLALLLQGLTLPAIMEQVEEQVPALALVIDFVGHLGLAAIAVLFFVFPDGRFVPRWTRFFAIGVALLTLVSFTAFIVPQGGGVAPGGNPLEDGLIALIVMALPVGIFAQIYRYRRVSDPVTRQQVKWVVFALSAAVVGAGVGFSANFLSTLPPSRSTTSVLPATPTQPGGALPTAMDSKSSFIGTRWQTRTRATASRPFALAVTRPAENLFVASAKNVPSAEIVPSTPSMIHSASTDRT